MSETEFYQEDFPTCPFCENVINDSYELLDLGCYSDENMEDGAIWSIKCPDCNKEFWTQTVVSYAYNIYQNEEDVV